MPCIIFSVHLRLQAAHYLHSTQISGLVSEGISFRSEWICLLSKGRACHTHLLKGVTLKRACVHVVPHYTQLFIWIFDTCKTNGCCTKVAKKIKRKKKNLNSGTEECNYFLPEQQPIKSKVSASFYRASVIFCWATAWRRDVWCCSSKMTSGKRLALKFDLFPLPSLSLRCHAY